MSQHPPLTFIVGTGRCGSTLLHEILAKHADTSFISAIEETHRRLAFLRRWSNAIYRLESAPLIGRLASVFRPTEAYGLIDRQVCPIYSRPFRDLTADDVTPWLERRFLNFFARRARAGGRPLLVHKYTGWSRIGFFARIFPEARFLHVVRDGRAVASSWLQMRWWNGYQGTSHWQWGELPGDHRRLWQESGRSHVVLAALCWDLLLRSYEDAKRGLGAERYLELRYEDFVGDPAGYCRTILGFMGLEWSADFRRQLDGFEIRESRKAAYQSDLSPAQARSIERAVGPRLGAYGYEV